MEKILQKHSKAQMLKKLELLRKLKAAKYALKAVGEKSDKSASISSEDRGGTVTVKGKR